MSDITEVENETVEDQEHEAQQDNEQDAPADDQSEELKHAAENAVDEAEKRSELSESQKRRRRREETRRRREAEELERLKQEIQELKTAATQSKAVEKPVEDVAPKREQFDYDEDKYQAALLKYNERLIQKETDRRFQEYQRRREQEDLQRQYREEQERIARQFDAQKDKVREMYPDYDEWIEDAPEMLPAVGMAVMQAGPAVEYHLAKNPDLIEKLNGYVKQKRLDKAIYEVGLLAGKIGSQVKKRGKTNAPKPQQKPSSTSGVQKNFEDMTRAERAQFVARLGRR